MEKRELIPEIADAVRHWMPHAHEEEQKQATVNLRRYLAVVYRLFLRLEAEGKLPKPRDNSEDGDTVDSYINNDV
jgi:hypothetical protein